MDIQHKIINLCSHYFFFILGFSDMIRGYPGTHTLITALEHLESQRKGSEHGDARPFWHPRTGKVYCSGFTVDIICITINKLSCTATVLCNLKRLELRLQAMNNIFT